MAPAHSTLLKNPPSLPGYSNIESPLAKKVSNQAVSCPAPLATATKRKNTLIDLGEAVPQVEVQFFLGSQGILPKLAGGRTKVKTVVDTLKKKNILVESGETWRWKYYPRNPSGYPDLEDVVFRDIEKIVSDIQDASGIGEGATLVFKCNPWTSPDSSTRNNETKPDCYGLLASALPNAHSGNAHWVNIGVPGEFKKSPKNGHDVENWTQVLWSMNYVMQEDARRRFAFAFTIEDTDMRIWMASRTEVLVSLPFDFITNYHHTIEFFLRLMCADECQLGWDPTMTRITPLHPGSEVQYTIECEGVKYKTVRLISDIGAEALRGRGTRVWEVREIKANGEEDPKPLVLKDSWADASREREGIILQKIREDALESGAATPETFDKHFVKVRAYGDVYINGALDHTEKLIRCGRPLKGKIEKPLEVKADPSPRMRLKSNAGPTGATMMPAGHVRNEPAQYEAKIHHRIIFDEVGARITEVDTISMTFYYLSQAVKGLSILHSCGWVHRDISTGNILVIDGAGKLTDFEYAKRQDDTTSHGIRTGTPYFMSIEVEKQKYLYGVRPLDEAVTSTEAEYSESKFLAFKMSMLAENKSPPSDTASDATNPSTHDDHSAPIPEPDPDFRHNPLHDLESMLWVGAWNLVCPEFVNPGKGISDEQWSAYLLHHMRYAKELFDNRLDAFQSPNDFLAGFKNLLPQVQQAAKILDSVRMGLLSLYHVANSRLFESGKQVPFQEIVATMHKTMLTQFLAMATDFLKKGDLNIDVLSSTGQRLRYHSTVKRRTAEDAQLDDTDQSRKRSKGNRPQKSTMGPPLAYSGPSGGTRSRTKSRRLN